jgi:hypothetical protein
MKTLLHKIVLVSAFSTFFISGCTDKFDEINTNPNAPVVVPSTALLTAAEKSLMDDINDEWWSGRFGMLLSEYWSQNNYTDEDRYNFRDGTNNDYWRRIYTDIMDLQEVIRLNTDPATMGQMAAYGANVNQIAVATTLKMWAMQIITDTWGNVPYSEAFQAQTGIPSPVYDSQQSIYEDMLTQLKWCNDNIDLSLDGPTSGDVIFGGDMNRWKKFANSLRMRVALRASKVPGFDAYTQVLDAYNDGAFESNYDNATFKYIGVSPNVAPMYSAYYIDARTDFSVTSQFLGLLEGSASLNAAQHNPFLGISDPRLPIFASPASSNNTYIGIPYGMEDSNTKVYGAKGSSWPGEKILAADFSCILMDYAEVCFILSEVNSWNQTWYSKGITASMEYWGVDAADISSYLAVVPAANEENVLTQKYIALYTQGIQAWAEYRRTGFPLTLVHPGMITGPGAGGVIQTFEPIRGSEIPRRMYYPVQEQTLNATSYKDAKAAMTGDDFDTRMWWDK